MSTIKIWCLQSRSGQNHFSRSAQIQQGTKLNQNFLGESNAIIKCTKISLRRTRKRLQSFWLLLSERPPAGSEEAAFGIPHPVTYNLIKLSGIQKAFKGLQEILNKRWGIFPPTTNPDCWDNHTKALSYPKANQTNGVLPQLPLTKLESILLFIFIFISVII